MIICAGAAQRTEKEEQLESRRNEGFVSIPRFDLKLT